MRIWPEIPEAIASGVSRTALADRLARVDLRTLEKHSRKKRRAGRYTAYYYKPYTNQKGKKLTKLSRGDYFLKLKVERAVVKILAKTPPPENFNKKNRAMIHRLYYRTLPFFFVHLSFWWDQSILRDIEHYYYWWLNRANFSRGIHSKVDRLSIGIHWHTQKEKRIFSLSNRTSVPHLS